MTHRLVICIRNTGHRASLERRKIYEVIPDPDAEKYNQIRVIDESGKDYLYPRDYFVSVTLPEEIRAAVIQVA
jgi:hypothetical protein